MDAACHQRVGNGNADCQRQAIDRTSRRQAPEQGESQAVARSGKPRPPHAAATGSLPLGNDYQTGGRAGLGAGNQPRIGRIAFGQDIDVETSRQRTKRRGDGSKLEAGVGSQLSLLRLAFGLVQT